MADGIMKGVSGGVSQTIPKVYEDGLQPAVKEVGKALGTTAKLVNVAISPLRGFLWGWEQFENYLSTTVAEKLVGIPEERIISPKPTIAVPALQALQYCHEEEHLKDLYAQLLATSMDSLKVNLAHPSFVEIIRNMTSDEARIMSLFYFTKAYPVIDIRRVEPNKVTNKYFNLPPSNGHDVVENYSLLGKIAKCEAPLQIDCYLDNLSRLGLVYIRDNMLTAEGVYDDLKNDQLVKSWIEGISKENTSDEPQIIEKNVKISPFGEMFLSACIKQTTMKKTE